MRIELYFSPYCPVCRGLDSQALAGLSIVRKNIVRHIEEAVRLGIVRPPALVLDGQLIAQGPAVAGTLQKLAREQADQR